MSVLCTNLLFFAISLITFNRVVFTSADIPIYTLDYAETGACLFWAPILIMLFIYCPSKSLFYIYNLDQFVLIRIKSNYCENSFGSDAMGNWNLQKVVSNFIEFFYLFNMSSYYSFLILEDSNWSKNFGIHVLSK